ncbi:MAG: ATP-grasp domain-containing protein, partial [Bacteroidales bacterium]|nr:ATP-grasp domain-containing protein [Bacteroidales bacterium]
GMPYSCCGVLAAALTCSKYFCNKYLSPMGIPVAKSILLHKGESIATADVIGQLGLPVFVKPNAGGSSYATTKVKTADALQPAIAEAMNESTGEVIIESFMQGTEITCGCYTSRDGLRALPITEVCPKDEFFDLDAKYNGAVEEITPARISAELTAQVQETTKRIYRYVGAKGIIRVDYIIIDGVPHLLEVNTTPGMTATSFIPQEVRAAGLDIKDVMDDVINASMR